jgi:hypothetical protein
MKISEDEGAQPFFFISGLIGNFHPRNFFSGGEIDTGTGASRCTAGDAGGVALRVVPRKIE